LYPAITQEFNIQKFKESRALNNKKDVSYITDINTGTMRDEVAAAVVFLTRLVKYHEGLSKEEADEFSSKLTAVLVERFKNHWYSTKPMKGQAYRCIRINESEPVDPVLDKVASLINVRYADLRMPEMTLWIDPCDVTARLGENPGATYTVFNEADGGLDLDVGDMLRAHQQQKAHALHRLQESARRRTNKQPAASCYRSNAGYRNNYYQQARHASPADSPSTSPPAAEWVEQTYYRQPSPPVEYYQQQQMAPTSLAGGGGRDRYRWVRSGNQDIVVAQ
jgi:protein Tob/BTG